MIGSSAGCADSKGIAPGDVRRYTVPAVEEPPSATALSSTIQRQTSASRRDAVSRAATPGRLRLTYELPEGWTDRGGGGLRLATLAIGEPTDGHEVTVIPAAGTLESNVTRWQGQLDPESDAAATAAAVRTALDNAETVSVGTTTATVVFLVETGTHEAGNAGDARAILGAMIPLDETASLFIKYMGDAAVAHRERGRFVEFVKTLRWQ